MTCSVPQLVNKQINKYDKIIIILLIRIFHSVCNYPINSIPLHVTKSYSHNNYNCLLKYSLSSIRVFNLVDNDVMIIMYTTEYREPFERWRWTYRRFITVLPDRLISIIIYRKYYYGAVHSDRVFNYN